MLPDEIKTDSFTEFVAENEPRLRAALTASWGPDLGRDAVADALAYGWEHWDRVSSLENPAGYLYRVGQNAAKRTRRRGRLTLPPPDHSREPWVEPRLPVALADLPDQQRTVVALLHGYQWSMSEVAEILGVSKSTVQSYAERGLRRLRRRLGVNR